jgi:hypothetical protein
MTVLARVLALASVGVGSVAAAVLSWGTLPLTQRPSKSDGATVPRNIFCVGADAVLRALPSGDTCPAGQRQYELSVAELRDLTDSDPWPLPPPPRKRLSGRAADLDRRLAALETSPMFEVVDANGALLFRVAQGSATVHDHGDTALAGILATGEGGVLVARTGDGRLESSMGASANRGGLRIVEAGLTRADVAKQQAGNYSLRVPSLNGNIVAIGESREGSGSLIVGDATGTARALMTAAGGKGTFDIFNRTGLTVLSLTRGDALGGSLVIADAASEPAVKMNNNGRYGAVLAGPVAGFPLIQGSGLPGSYILGCAGGDACRQ